MKTIFFIIVIFVSIWTYSYWATYNKRMLILKQHDCYLIGESNPGGITSNRVYRCNGNIVHWDKLEKLKK